MVAAKKFTFSSFVCQVERRVAPVDRIYSFLAPQSCYRRRWTTNNDSSDLTSTGLLSGEEITSDEIKTNERGDGGAAEQTRKYTRTCLSFRFRTDDVRTMNNTTWNNPSILIRRVLLVAYSSSSVGNRYSTGLCHFEHATNISQCDRGRRYRSISSRGVWRSRESQRECDTLTLTTPRSL